MDAVALAAAPAAFAPEAAAAPSGRRGRGRPTASDAAAASAAEAAAPDLAEPRDVTDLMGVSLHALTTQHQSVQNFGDWLDRRKTIADTARIESRNHRDAGRLISTELVRQTVFALLEAEHLRLLGTAPRTIAVRAVSSCKSGRPLEEIRATVEAAICAELRVSKRQILNTLRRCKVGDTPPEVHEPAQDAPRPDTRLAKVIAARLRDVAARAIIDTVLKAVGRAAVSASGPGWNAVVFEQVMASAPALIEGIEPTIATMLTGHVQKAVTEFSTEEQQK